MKELRDVVRSVLSRHPDEAWPRLRAEVGVAGLAIPEAYGGAGATLAETHVVLEELGRELTPHPLLGMTLATQAILRTGNTEAAKRLLPRIAEGAPATVLLPGEAFVIDAADALLLVVADGQLHEASGTVTPCVPLDESRSLSKVDWRLGEALGPADAEELRGVASVALSAEQVGAAARALELTVEYTKTRVQFGRPIASFQALQHRLADLHVLACSARAVSYAAVAGRVHPCVAKVTCSQALMTVASEMIQLHGGIGITWEHSAHRYFKRAHNSWHLFGAPAEHVLRLSAACLATEGAEAS